MVAEAEARRRRPVAAGGAGGGLGPDHPRTGAPHTVATAAAVGRGVFCRSRSRVSDASMSLANE